MREGDSTPPVRPGLGTGLGTTTGPRGGQHRPTWGRCAPYPHPGPADLTVIHRAGDDRRGPAAAPTCRPGLFSTIHTTYDYHFVSKSVLHP